MPLVERAPAKINLTLHVVGRRADGLHELESLVAFTRSGDTLTLEPGMVLSLAVAGPSAGTVGPNDDNLVMRAARAFSERVAGSVLGTFTLTKRLPVAAGIGGGSSDAAAALRLLARANRVALDDPRVIGAAAATGADVSVCLAASARMMRGIGDELGPVLSLPPLPALIVNPGVPLETRAVFARMGRAIGWSDTASAHPALEEGASAERFAAVLARGRNDMEDAACVLAPVVSDVLAILAAARGCRLARMSGSGATCFGLFADCRAVSRAKRALDASHPGWWTKATMLG